MKYETYPLDEKTVQELVDKRICVSRGEARRLTMMMPPEELRKRINRVKVVTKK